MKIRKLLTGFAVAAVAVLAVGLGAAPANAATIGVCTIQAQNPHPSTHVNGTINGVGTVNCTSSVPEIYIYVVLQKSTGESWANPSRDYANTSSQQNNGASPCSAGPGIFRVETQYAITFPAGASPAYSAGAVDSPWMQVACGSARVAA
ncbi:hypothetical protein, partial [Subtercola boreus]